MALVASAGQHPRFSCRRSHTCPKGLCVVCSRSRLLWVLSPTQRYCWPRREHNSTGCWAVSRWMMSWIGRPCFLAASSSAAPFARHCSRGRHWLCWTRQPPLLTSNERPCCTRPWRHLVSCPSATASGSWKVTHTCCAEKRTTKAAAQFGHSRRSSGELEMRLVVPVARLVHGAGTGHSVRCWHSGDDAKGRCPHKMYTCPQP
mmetsp:Transcript_32282/g.85989  ORF Transcript_32282/g.85989 Transcript_32282/m.85989 type:complete len:203 (-) Transcript_32282:177-785(-)